MRRSAIISAFVVLGLGVFGLAIVWPTFALIGSALFADGPPTGGFTFGARLMGLLWRSTWLAGIATLACMLVALPGMIAVGRAWRVASSPTLVAVLAASLLCPPMVYVFGWDRLLPVGVSPELRCLAVWTLWAWPIPALLIGGAWSRSSRWAHDAALLDAPIVRVIARIDLPALAGVITLSLAILFILFFADYGVPHACGLIVYATELLGWASSSARPIDTLWPAIPGLMVCVAGLLAVYAAWRRTVPEHEGANDPKTDTAGAQGSRPAYRLVWLVFVVTWCTPMAALAAKLESWQVIAVAARTYADSVAATLAIALAAAIVVVTLGCGVVMWRPLRRVATVWTVIFGLIPGALVGEALIAAYSHGPLSGLYYSWPILALGHVARFAWLGVLGAALIRHRTDRGLIDQAATDGATPDAILTGVLLPLQWPMLVAIGGLVAVLAFGELPTTSMLSVPGIGSIPLIIVEKFHRFEDGMLIALSLTTVAVACVGAGLLSIAFRRALRGLHA